MSPFPYSWFWLLDVLEKTAGSSGIFLSLQGEAPLRGSLHSLHLLGLLVAVGKCRGRRVLGVGGRQQTLLSFG